MNQLIKLDLRTDLIKVIPEKLGSRTACQYSAPCAIGAMMTSDQRAQLVEAKQDARGIGTLVVEGFVSVPADQLDDFRRLQRAFDWSVAEFDLVLAELKEKYTI